MPYTVALDAYHGPLDLLLYLVKRHEVDVLDVRISVVADQFRDYLATLAELDLEFAGEFLVLAATLMDLKSRALLPAGAEPAGEAAADTPDPRRELVKQLLEYRQFKDAAAALEDRAHRHAARVPRQGLPDDGDGADAGPAVRPVEVWDLVSAFARLVRETQATAAAVVADDTPQGVYEAELGDRVRAAGRLPFRAAFTPPYSKPRLIGLFLALLELVRHHGLGLEQPDPAGEIWLVAAAGGQPDREAGERGREPPDPPR